MIAPVVTPAADAPATPTAERILDVAEGLAQTRGFNGFSYADIALAVGITKASLHYHYRTKAALGRALVARYSERFASALDAIEAHDGGGRERLERYVELFEAVLVRDRMCLCGMLAAEYLTLPPPLQEEVRRFFDRNERWLAEVLLQGRRTETLAFEGSARDLARYLTGALEGAMLLAYAYGDSARFRVAAERLLSEVAPDRGKG